MPVEQAIDLGRLTMREVFVLTSLQETTVAAVPKLLAVGAGVFFLMPWMWKQLCQFTLQLFSDFHPYLR